VITESEETRVAEPDETVEGLKRTIGALHISIQVESEWRMRLERELDEQHRRYGALMCDFRSRVQA